MHTLITIFMIVFSLRAEPEYVQLRDHNFVYSSFSSFSLRTFSA